MSTFLLLLCTVPLIIIVNYNSTPMNISGDFRLMQWNCCGIRSKLPQMQAIANDLDIMCIQESLLRPDNKFWLKGFNVLRKDIVSPYQRGICILIKNNFIYSKINLNNFNHPSWEIQGIAVSVANDLIAIVNVYRHPNLTTPYNVYHQLFFFLLANYRNFIVVGDFNAHHSWWGCQHNDSHGNSLSCAIDMHRLILLNDRISPTLLHPTALHSIIDLTLSSENFSTCCNTSVGHDTFGSDHFPIFTFIASNFIKRKVFLYKLKLSRKDLDLLYYSLINSLDKIRNILLENYLLAYEALDLHIRNQLSSLFPAKTCQPRSRSMRSKLPSPPWWNDICLEAVKERKTAIRRYLKLPSLDNYEKYKRARLTCSKTLKKQKRLGWKKFCSNFNCKTPTSEIWSLIKCFKRRKKIDSSSILPPDDISQSQHVNDAIDKLCPPSCKHLAWSSLSHMEAEDHQLNGINFDMGKVFSETELYAAIKKMKLNSAPGIDQIDNRVISTLPNEYYKIVLAIFNSILVEGSFPTQWKQSLVILIPKFDSHSFRPISLLSCLLKLMERMVYNRLQWHVESQYIIPDSQFGFRPGRSCTDCLVTFSCEVYNGFAHGFSTIAAFLDIKGAFDNVIPNILIQELANIGVPARIRMFIYNLISDRSLQFIVGGENIGPFSSNKGTPQGSTLSPLLFDIYVKDITKFVHQDSKILLYADDITVYSTASNPLEAFTSVQSSINGISNFLRDKGLDLSPSKSNWMIFTKSRSVINLPPLNINNDIIPKVDSVRFLGVIFDAKMTGKHHIKFLVKKGSSIVDILSALAGTWWGSHPQLLLNLYRSTFRSSIEYGCHVFRFHLNKSCFASLERLQYRAIRIAMGYRISTPINVMLHESKETPLKLRFLYHMRKFLVKSMSRKFNPVIDCLDSMKNSSHNRKKRNFLVRTFPIFRQFLYIFHYRNIIHSVPYLPYFFFDYDSALLEISPCMNMLFEIENHSNESINQIFLEKSEPFSSNATSFYTDGSKCGLDGPTGASVYSPDIKLGIMHRLPAETSVFSAEAWAIYVAINTIIDLKCDKAVIFTDSKSVLEALSPPLTQNNNYLIHYIRNSWSKCIQFGTDLGIFWVPSHKGIPGNEMADSLAKKAISHGFKPNFLVPFPDLYAEVKESLNNQFSAYLNNAALIKGTFHASLYQDSCLISEKPWYYDKPLKRKEIVLINRIRSNHYNLNYSLFRKNMSPSAACQCGDPRQDINHIIFYCPITIPRSLRLRTYLRSNHPNQIIDIFPILKDPNPKLIRLLLSFLLSNDILI